MKTILKYLKKNWILLFAVLAAGLVWESTRLAYNDALDELIETGEERLTLIDGTLVAALNQYAYLPYILAENREIRCLLGKEDLTEYVNRYLEALSVEAGCEALFIMDKEGNTIAVSNWNEPQTYFGENYGFRPYFLSAKAGKKGWHYGVGATTGVPGYFMSRPVFKADQFIGAVIVKVDLAPLQEDWKKGGETVLVSDANGITFLSSRNDLRYHTMTPLTDTQLKAIQVSRLYGDQSLDLLGIENKKELNKGQTIVRLNRIQYLMLSRALPEQNWQLHYLMPLAQVQEWRQAVGFIGGILALLLLALAMYLRERKQKQISRRKAKEAGAMREINLRLQDEINERTRTEKALRDAQEELVQTGKLAALGHMAAGIVHELNQPISAIRTHAASAQLLLDRKQFDKVKNTFAAIARMTEHMSSITTQLKTFAHQSPTGPKQALLQECMDEALIMTAPLISEHNISLIKSIPDRPVQLAGDRVRIRQVLVNLIRNAVDAMHDSSLRKLEITVEPEEKEVEISVSDSGVGISEQALNELFTPFFTTKEVGEGLGLGLSISYRIISDLGGSVRAWNLPGGGACFIIRLPVV